METYERIRFLRKDNLKLSQEKFGEILGVNRDVIKNIELNLLARPEQKEPLLKLICKTFNVRYEWLTAGKGDMYVKTSQSLIERVSAEHRLSVYIKSIVECYLRLDLEQREVIDLFIKAVSEASNAASGAKDIKVDDILNDTIEALRTERNENNTEHENVSD